MDSREIVVSTARSYIDVPYKYRGRDHKGVDCAGLLYVAFKVLNSKLRDFIDYPPHPTPPNVFSLITQYANRIPKELAAPADIVLLRFASRSAHFGILTDTGVIHACDELRKVVEHSIPTRGIGRVSAYYRWKDIDPWPA